jgi:hypothetical protein
MADPGFVVGFSVPSGAGVYCSNAVFEYCTIVSNRLGLWATFGFGDAPEFPTNGIAGVFSDSGQVEFHAVILSNGDTNVSGAIVDRGFNLLNVADSHFLHATTRTGVDPKLQAFESPGFAPGYFGLAPDSPAIDNADEQRLPKWDIRGVPRITGSRPDIGAVEFTPDPVLHLSVGRTHVNLNVIDDTGEPAAVETSGDLVDWIPIFTASTNGPTLELRLPILDRMSFYRARRQP